MQVKKFECHYDFACNLYVINKNNTIIVIDPGFYDETLKDYLNKYKKVDAILLTHGHFDHIKGLDKLVNDFKTDVYIYKDEYDFLNNPSLNMMPNLIINSKVNKIDDRILDINGIKIDVIHTPGHTKGSVMYFFKEDNILFSGDTIFHNGIGRIDLPTSNYEDMKNTINNFIDLKLNDNTIIYPGHEEETTYNEEIEYLKTMRF